MQSPPFKDSPIEVDQRLLFPSNIFDLLAEDNDCFVYEEIFTQLDMSVVEQQYSRIGQRAYHPRALVSILIYAYSHGVFSSREIQRRCR
jgi:transposase